MPDFISREPHPNTGKVRLVRYADDDPSKIVMKTQVYPDSENKNLETDSLSGYIAVGVTLNKLLKN